MRQCPSLRWSGSGRCYVPRPLRSRTLPIHFAAMKWKCPKAECPPTDIPPRDVTSFEGRRSVAKWVNTFNRRASEFR
jgi:hypothetical protein